MSRINKTDAIHKSNENLTAQGTPINVSFLTADGAINSSKLPQGIAANVYLDGESLLILQTTPVKTFNFGGQMAKRTFTLRIPIVEFASAIESCANGSEYVELKAQYLRRKGEAKDWTKPAYANWRIGAATLPHVDNGIVYDGGNNNSILIQPLRCEVNESNTTSVNVNGGVNVVTTKMPVYSAYRTIGFYLPIWVCTQVQAIAANIIRNAAKDKATPKAKRFTYADVFKSAK